MSPEQRELFDLIRGITMNSMYRVNDEMRKWLNENSARELAQKKSIRAKHLDEQLGLLRQHLNMWFDKYDSIFNSSERRSLVYLTDEKGHGERFPPELETTIEELLAELEGRPISSKQTHKLGRSVLELDLVALRDFKGTLHLFNGEINSEWGKINSRWSAASDSWRDFNKDQFSDAKGWDEVVKAMEAYLATSEQYARFLSRLEERAISYHQK